MRIERDLKSLKLVLCSVCWGRLVPKQSDLFQDSATIGLRGYSHLGPFWGDVNPLPSCSSINAYIRTENKQKPGLDQAWRPLGKARWGSPGSNFSFSLSNECFSDHSSGGGGVSLGGSHSFWHRGSCSPAPRGFGGCLRFPGVGPWGHGGCYGPWVWRAAPEAWPLAGAPWNMAEVPLISSGFGEMTHALARYTLGCLQYYGELGINIAIWVVVSGAGGEENWPLSRWKRLGCVFNYCEVDGRATSVQPRSWPGVVGTWWALAGLDPEPWTQG